jgi:hypothetical protein
MGQPDTGGTLSDKATPLLLAIVALERESLVSSVSEWITRDGGKK